MLVDEGHQLIDLSVSASVYEEEEENFNLEDCETIFLTIEATAAPPVLRPSHAKLRSAYHTQSLPRSEGA